MSNSKQFNHNLQKAKRQHRAEREIHIGAKVKIVDNYHEHRGYVKNTVLKVTNLNEDGYYILSNMYSCSESEIQII